MRAAGLLRLFVLLLAAGMPLQAHAYIDPNSGGWLFQMVFPVLVAIGMAWGFVRDRVSALLRRIFKRKEQPRQ